MQRKQETEELLGHVTVDSGRLLIFDPAYTRHLREHFVGQDKGPSMENHFGGSVVVLRGFGGDGRFVVRGTYKDGLLVRATIDFQR